MRCEHFPTFEALPAGAYRWGVKGLWQRVGDWLLSSCFVAMAPVQLESHQLVPVGGGPASAPAPPPPGTATAAASPGYRLSTLIDFLLHRTYAELTVLADL